MKLSTVSTLVRSVPPAAMAMTNPARPQIPCANPKAGAKPGCAEPQATVRSKGRHCQIHAAFRADFGKLEPIRVGRRGCTQKPRTTPQPPGPQSGDPANASKAGGEDLIGLGLPQNGVEIARGSNPIPAWPAAPSPHHAWPGVARRHPQQLMMCVNGRGQAEQPWNSTCTCVASARSSPRMTWVMPCTASSCTTQRW